MGIDKAVRSKDILVVKRKGGGINMKMIIAIGLLMLLSGIAAALTTDSVVLTVQPNFNLSVNISSATYGFGSLDLGTTSTLCIGQIENDGNVSSKWQKQASSRSDCASTPSTNGWSLVSGDGTYTGSNSLMLLAVTTGTTVLPTSNGGGFSATACLAGSHNTTGIGVGTGSWTDLTEGGASSPTHPKSEIRKLWVSLLMPTNTTNGEQQTITLSVQAIVQ